MDSILRIRDENGNIVEVLALRGRQGEKGEKGDTGIQGPKGDTGEPGPAYILNDADKVSIVTAVLHALPVAEEANF